MGKHFGKNHKYHKIFNYGNVKISYSCVDNFTNIICSQNRKVTNLDSEANGKTCNGRNKSNCLLDNKCLTNKFVYKTEVKTDACTNELSTKVYSGISKKNLSLGTTTMQRHLEIGHTKIIPNFRNIFGA